MENKAMTSPTVLCIGLSRIHDYAEDGRPGVV